jgi:hypothetical protein
MAVRKALGIRAFWVSRRAEKALAEFIPFTEVKDVGEAARLIVV